MEVCQNRGDLNSYHVYEAKLAECDMCTTNLDAADFHIQNAMNYILDLDIKDYSAWSIT